MLPTTLKPHDVIHFVAYRSQDSHFDLCKYGMYDMPNICKIIVAAFEHGSTNKSDTDYRTCAKDGIVASFCEMVVNVTIYPMSDMDSARSAIRMAGRHSGGCMDMCQERRTVCVITGSVVIDFVKALASVQTLQTEPSTGDPVTVPSADESKKRRRPHLRILCSTCTSSLPSDELENCSECSRFYCAQCYKINDDDIVCANCSTCPTPKESDDDPIDRQGLE